MASWNSGRFAKWRKNNPWYRFGEWSRRRCNDSDPKSRWYPHYYARGIKSHLTIGQLKELWERDEAHKLKRPSLDRINPEFDYANWNCRFIEFSLNARLAWDKTSMDDSKAEYV